VFESTTLKRPALNAGAEGFVVAIVVEE
jgi:hypothetical protein